MSDTRKVVAFFNVDDEGFATPEEPTLMVAKFMRLFRGQRVQGTFMLPEDAKSKEQLGYYFAVVCLALEHEGWTKEDVDGHLRRKFLRGRTSSEGDDLELAGLTWQEMHDYLDECIPYLQGKGGHVPSSEEWKMRGQRR